MGEVRAAAPQVRAAGSPRSLFAPWSAQGPTQGFLQNPASSQLHTSCRGLRPWELSDSRDTWGSLGGTRCCSKVTEL